MGGVCGVAFSPDGKRLVSAGGDGTVKIWDLSRAQGGLGIPARQVTFAPDGKLAMIVDRTSTLPVCDAATGQEVRTLLKDVHGGIDKMIFSPDGKRIAGVLGGTGLSGRLIKVWDAASGQELLTLKGHANGVTGVAFSPDGKRLVSAGG